MDISYFESDVASMRLISLAVRALFGDFGNSCFVVGLDSSAFNFRLNLGLWSDNFPLGCDELEITGVGVGVAEVQVGVFRNETE